MGVADSYGMNIASGAGNRSYRESGCQQRVSCWQPLSLHTAAESRVWSTTKNACDHGGDRDGAYPQPTQATTAFRMGQ